MYFTEGSETHFFHILRCFHFILLLLLLFVVAALMYLWVVGFGWRVLLTPTLCVVLCFCARKGSSIYTLAFARNYALCEAKAFLAMWALLMFFFASFSRFFSLTLRLYRLVLLLLPTYIHIYIDMFCAVSWHVYNVVFVSNKMLIVRVCASWRALACVNVEFKCSCNSMLIFMRVYI